ncbi:MAG: hypothetical protein V2A56_05920 [bacterium]
MISSGIHELLQQYGMITLPQLQEGLPRRRDGQTSTIGMNRLREFARLGLIRATVLNRQEQVVLNREQVEWFFRTMPTGDPNRQLIHQSWYEDNLYLGESIRFSDLDSLSPPAKTERKEELRELRRVLKEQYRQLASLLSDSQEEDLEFLRQRIVDRIAEIRKQVRNQE